MRRMFCVQPYRLRHHKLVAGGATLYDDREAAIEAGRHLARRCAGLVVLAQEVDTWSGARTAPEVLAVHGRVPEGWQGARERALAA